MKQEKKTWFWVVGDTKKGFRITTKRPRTKFVREPFYSNLAANNFIALEYLKNA